MVALTAFDDWLLARPGRAAALVLAASVALLGGALAFQFVGEMAPCALCLEQRKPYWVTIPLAALVVVAGPRLGRRAAGAALAACAAAFAAGAALAIFHVGVEQHWWAGPAACRGAATIAPDAPLAEVRRQLLAAPVVRCDAVPWSLAGISLAGYNALASAALAAGTARAAWRLAGRPA